MASATERDLAEVAQRPRHDDANGDQAAGLARLAAEICLLEELVAHVKGQCDRAGRRLERLERSRATRRETRDRRRAVWLSGEAVAVKSELARLGLATSLAEQLALLRSAEARELLATAPDCAQARARSENGRADREAERQGDHRRKEQGIGHAS